MQKVTDNIFLLVLFAMLGTFILAASFIFFDWKYVLAVFGVRLLVQGFVLYKSMKKMGEKDLWPWFILLDMWMFFYYIIFAPALWKRPKKGW